MAHLVDGFDLTYTGRTSWKAERRHAGKLIDIVPVTWTKGRAQSGGEVFQEVWFQDAAEMERYRTSNEPFVVAVAMAKNYSVFPHQFHEFRAIFEVKPTGVVLSEQSIETRVLRRLTTR